MDPLFPELPEDLGALSDEELNELIDRHVAAIRAIRENDEEFIGELSGNEVLEQLRTGVEQWRTLTTHRDGRDAEIENYEGAVADLAAEVLSSTEDEPGEPSEPEPSEPEPGEPEPEPEPSEPEDEPASGEAAAEEPVTASVAVRRPPRPAPDRIGQQPEHGGNVLRAVHGLADVRPGQALDRLGFRNALIDAWFSGTAVSRTDVPVAKVSYPYPIERQLDGRNGMLNSERISPARAVTAAGGLCAPFPSFYDLNVISVDDRPVRDALTSFQATRGGVSVPTNLSRADVSDGVGIVTAEDDETGGTFALKTCVDLECEPWTDYNIDAVYACITHHNLNARAWPERVDAASELLASQHATVAETNLLDQISLGSTAIADEAKYGAVSTYLQGIIKMAAAYRSFHRTSENVRLRALIPRWLPDMLLVDMIHGQFDRFHPRAFITTLLNQAGVDPTFYYDSATADAGTQIFAAQAGPNALEFPTTVVWYLFEAGGWLFLDFGELNLGVVRDSELNLSNTFQIFRETFEGAAFVGVESLKITTTICPNGTYAPAGSAITC